jgi:hypothetical protein
MALIHYFFKFIAFLVNFKISSFIYGLFALTRQFFTNNVTVRHQSLVPNVCIFFKVVFKVLFQRILTKRKSKDKLMLTVKPKIVKR